MRFKNLALTYLSDIRILDAANFFSYKILTFGVANSNKFSVEIWTSLVFTDLGCLFYHLRWI